MRRDRIDTGVWTRRAKRRAWVCVVGTALGVAGAIAVVGPQIGARNKHGISGLIASCLAASPHRSVDYYWPQRVIVARREGLIDVGTVFDQRGIAAVAESFDGGDHAWTVQVKEGTWLEGVWAATRKQFDADASVVFSSDSTAAQTTAGPATPDQVVGIRRIAIESINRKAGLRFPQSTQSMIATGHWRDVRVLPMGWLINAATLAGLTMFACTVRGTVCDIRRHRRALKYLREHLCGWCGHDVRGLAEGMDVCPECGKNLDRTGREPSVTG